MLHYNRFLWLRPMSSISSEAVSEHLQNIFEVHGVPETLLTDNGTEFKGAVKIMCKSLGVHMRHGRARHPQTTGKVTIMNNFCF